jgi:hypothetical protein
VALSGLRLARFPPPIRPDGDPEGLPLDEGDHGGDPGPPRGDHHRLSPEEALSGAPEELGDRPSPARTPVPRDVAAAMREVYRLRQEINGSAS